MPDEIIVVNQSVSFTGFFKLSAYDAIAVRFWYGTW